MMDVESFKPLFHESWHDKIMPFIESKECDVIYKHLKRRSGRGKKIAPSHINTFRAFIETPLNEVKVIMMGLCPYHSFRNGKPVADGLLMSTRGTGKIQPSLDKFYDGLKRELSPNEDIIKLPDLAYLAHQGVFLGNVALTVEANKPMSHNKIWEPFTRYLFEEVFDDNKVPVIFLGKEAAKFKRFVIPFSWIFELSHPASASYREDEWDSEGVFTTVNHLLSLNKQSEINWLKHS